MPDTPNNLGLYPFTTFNFKVLITLEGVTGQLCNAAFAECDGLEITMEPKTIREGGNNFTQYRLAGPRAYGTLTLKRGMTTSFDLWSWFQDTLHDPALRAEVQVVMLAADNKTVQAIFNLKRCLPVKLKAPALNAKDGLVAIEELQVVYETLALAAPKA